MEIGTRVKVIIQNADEWAVGAADSLNGKLGVVERTGGHSEGKILVRFDEPAERWWTYQTPPESFWFDERDLLQQRSS